MNSHLQELFTQAQMHLAMRNAGIHELFSRSDKAMAGIETQRLHLRMQVHILQALRPRGRDCGS